MERIERYLGSIVGLAVGDALGTTLEFHEPGSFIPITDMIGGGPFKLLPGQWTDDTSMALCLAESLIQCKGFNPVDQLKRYSLWYKEGYLSSTGKCFDIGRTVRKALHMFDNTGEPYCGSSDPRSAGNGSLMRLAPVPLFYAKTPTLAIEMSGESSRTTHGALTAIDACRYFGALIVGALMGIPKQELLSEKFTPVYGLWEDRPLCSDVAEVAAGTFKKYAPPTIRGTGYVVKALEAALWAFYNSDSFDEGALFAVNLGDDADTTGAIYGQLAGAYYGINVIRREWINKIALRDMLEGYANQLYGIAFNQ